VEDVAADQPVLLLHLPGADDLAVEDGALEVGGEVGVAVDHPVGVGLQLLGVGGVDPLVRAPLGEQRHHVHALGRQRLVEHRGDAAVGERPRRAPALLGVLEGLLDVVERQGHLDRAGVVLAHLAAGVGGEVGQLGEGEVDLDHAAAGLPALDVGDEVGRQLRPADLLQEGDPGVDGGDHHGRVQLLAAAQDHPVRAPAGDQHALDPGAGAHGGAELLGRAADRVGDRAHAALREAPAAEVAVADVPDRVVGHHVGGARRVRPRPGADHAVDRQARLDLLGLEPVVEQVADAHGHQPGRVADGAHVQAAVPPGEPQQPAHVGPAARAELGRRLHQQRPEHRRQPAQPGVPPGHGAGVALGELGDLLVVAGGVVGVELERAAVRPGLVVGAHGEDLVAVALQVEVADDARRHQAHHVRQPGDLDLRRLRPGRVGGGGAAGLVPGLQHHRARARPGQVGGGHQPVVAAADHDRVPGRGHGALRCWCLTERSV
jgi:hypothetical protein